MAKMMFTVGLLLACTLCGCSSSATPGRDRGQLELGSASAAMDAPAMQTTGQGFGNATQAQGPLQTSMDSTMPMAGAGAVGECEDGVFCAPTGPDQGCGKITFEAETEVTRNPGNLLLVFDRSSSMLEQWEGQPRWQAAGSAIVAALEPLSADIAQAGVVFFPTPPDAGAGPVLGGPGPGGPFGGPGCGVDGAHPSQIEFVPGDQFVGRFNMPGAGTPANGLMNLGPPVLVSGDEPPYFPVLGGFTPLMEGLQEAQNVLANTTLEGVTAVVVITDGQPNCMWNPATASQIVTDWNMNLGIPTHVIGLPGIGGAAGGLAGLIGQVGGMLDGTQVLNDLAQAGGTDQFITPADPAALQAQLASIVSETVSMGFDTCNSALNPAAAVPDELLMIVEEPGVTDRQQVPRDYGWELNPAGDQVTMSGQLCEQAMGGRFTSLTFEYACPEAPPPDPIPPLT